MNMTAIFNFISIALVIVCTCFAHTYHADNNGAITYYEKYAKGVYSYLENDWESCISNFEDALALYEKHKANIKRCRFHCANKMREYTYLAPSKYEMEKVFETLIRSTSCIEQCKKGTNVTKMQVWDPEVEKYFRERKPYDYLQLCFYKASRLLDAANAALTVLSWQPSNEVMQKNLDFYVAQAGIEVTSVKNLMSYEQESTYDSGVENYESGKYGECVSQLEMSLSLLIHEWHMCRLGCEDPFDQGMLLDFVASMANHYTYVLRCKISCSKDVAKYSGKDFLSLLMNYFEYLQFCYYKENALTKACESVATALMLQPLNADQQQNKQFYSSNVATKDAIFVPRQEMGEIKERINYEHSLLHFIEETFEDSTEDKLIPSKPKGDIYEETQKLLHEILSYPGLQFHKDEL